MDYVYALTSMYSESTYPEQTMDPAAMLIACVPALIVSIFLIICIWKIFTKCDEAGWKSIIPIYNMWIEMKLFWGEPCVLPFILLLFVPVANMVVAIMLTVKMARSFGKSGGFAVGLILLPIIFIPILAFGSDDYIGPDGDYYARASLKNI